MSSSDCLKVGVIGVGVQGQKHIECFQAAHNSTVTAICDANETLLNERAAEFGIRAAYTDCSAMLEAADTDAVAVVLPDHLHREVCEAAFSAGKHVLLEKPMATSVEDAEAIVAAQKRAGTKLMINWSNRWMPAFAGGKAALDAGKLGDPLYIYARLSNTLYVPTKMLSWSSGTRLPHWLICHRFDIARWYLGCEAKRVRAVCGSRVLKGMGIDTPDFYQATIEFENGVIGNFESCWVLPETLPFIVDSKFQMVCTNGYINVDPLLPVSVVADEEKATYGTPLFADVMGQPRGFVYDAICHFVDSVLGDKEPLITAEDGLAITRTMCAIVEAAETGETVEL